MRLRINGKTRSYKSLNFSLMKEKLLDGSKCQTCRTNNIASYQVGELIVIKHKKVPLFLVPVQKYYPRQISDFTPEEARMDGFTGVNEFQSKLMEINNINRKGHWSFITRWNPESRTLLRVIAKNKSTFICEEHKGDWRALMEIPPFLQDKRTLDTFLGR